MAGVTFVMRTVILAASESMGSTDDFDLPLERPLAAADETGHPAGGVVEWLACSRARKGEYVAPGRPCQGHFR